MKSSSFAVAAALGLAACNSASAPPKIESAAPAMPQIEAQGFHSPDGGGCGAAITRYRAIQDNDLAMGHVARSVYEQVKGELAAADQACSAGRGGDATAMVAASRARHGYPAAL